MQEKLTNMYNEIGSFEVKAYKAYTEHVEYMGTYIITDEKSLKEVIQEIKFGEMFLGKVQK